MFDGAEFGRSVVAAVRASQEPIKAELAELKKDFVALQATVAALQASNEQLAAQFAQKAAPPSDGCIDWTLAKRGRDGKDRTNDAA